MAYLNGICSDKEVVQGSLARSKPVARDRPVDLGLLRIGIDGATVPERTGLQLPRQLSFDRWLQIGKQLTVVVDTSTWWLGDWLAYGQDNYGDHYKDAIERTSLDYQTLRNYAWVARRFSPSRRRDKLSFAHHAEVAALDEPEQDFWLRKAESLHWSRNNLRRELRASLRERKNGKATTAAVLLADKQPESEAPGRRQESARTLSLPVSLDQFERCEQAASKQNRKLEEWALLVLDREARKGEGMHPPSSPLT